MFREVADIQTADMLKLPVPTVNYHNIKTKPSEIQTEMVASLAKRAEKVRARLVEPNIDNIFTDSKYRAAPDFAITHKEDNDTPVQSQPEREKTVAGNEGGSVRTTVGVELPWRQFAADRLATSHSISGCRGQIEMLLSYQPNERRS